ncbi:MAG: DUF3540 domain-containing protein [Alcaligenaceae bacterium]|nr:DUF3540 domain-containing protein [Alcaligenaceae bacterium]
MNLAPESTIQTDAPPVPAHSSGQARQYHARLVMHEGRRYCALTNEGAIWLTAAAGCLLQPAVGDVVLVSVTGANGYILSVLERGRPDQTAVMSVPGTLQLRAQNVEVCARSELSLDAGSDLHIKADAAQVDLDAARVRCQALSLQGDALHSRWNQRVDIAQEHIAIASYSETHLGRSTRRIAGHEEVTAASFRQSATQDWTVRAGTATLVGRNRAVIDGNSIQIG